MKVLVGSIKKMKLDAVRSAIDELHKKGHISGDWEVEGHKVSSTVPVTPYDDETIKGAEARAHSLHSEFLKEGDLFVGIESGLLKRNGTLFEEVWCVIIDKQGRAFQGISSALPVAKDVVDRIENGEVHFEILDGLAADVGVSPKETWGIYSQGRLFREVGIMEAFRNAFVTYLAEVDDKDR